MVTVNTTANHPTAHIRKTNLGCECMNWMQEAQIGGQSMAPVNTETILRFAIKMGIC
jgi:hypothetical protein